MGCAVTRGTFEAEKLDIGSYLGPRGEIAPRRGASLLALRL